MSACDPPPRTTELTAVQPCEVSMQDAMVVARPGPGGKRALSLLPMGPPGRVLESRELSVSCTCPVRFIKGVLCASLIHFLAKHNPFSKPFSGFTFVHLLGPFFHPPNTTSPCTSPLFSLCSLLCWRACSFLTSLLAQSITIATPSQHSRDNNIYNTNGTRLKIKLRSSHDGLHYPKEPNSHPSIPKLCRTS